MSGDTLQSYIQNCIDTQSIAFDLVVPMAPGPERAAEMHTNITGLLIEAAEVSMEIEWKPWRESNGLVNHGKLVEELADVMRFTLNIAAHAGITGEELNNAFLETSRKTIRRTVEVQPELPFN